VLKHSILESFDQLPYFTLASYKQISGADESQSQLVRETLSRWVKAGHILRLKKGVYMTRRFNDRHQGEASFAPAVSAILVPQSYVSLEYILQRSGVLTEITYPITGITPKNTRKIENNIGTFVYRHIKSSLYDGFSQVNYFGVLYNQASMSKALFDYFYFRPLPQRARTRKVNLAHDLRLNLADFSPHQRDEFAEYVEQSGSKKMAFVLDNLRRTEWRP
jgi:predicted transcriptional regulator of viral defense system